MRFILNQEGMVTFSRFFAGCGRWLLIMGVLSSAFSAEPATAQAGTKLQVVATTTIIGDVVRQIAEDLIELTVLLPPNADPHSYEPVPRDIAAISGSDVTFINGFNFEESLVSALEGLADEVEVVTVSDGITPLKFVDILAEGEHDPEDQFDPHVFQNPLNVMVWTQNIQAALSAADPAHAELYQANADLYRRYLGQLDTWTQQRVAEIPAENRKLVTDHDTFGYFADHYGFELVGAVIPSISTVSEPSARELAALEDAIRGLGAKAIFVGNTVNPSLAQQVADDTGTQLVFVYSDSLGASGEPGDTYLNFMKYNVNAVVGALK